MMRARLAFCALLFASTSAFSLHTAYAAPDTIYRLVSKKPLLFELYKRRAPIRGFNAEERLQSLLALIPQIESKYPGRGYSIPGGTTEAEIYVFGERLRYYTVFGSDGRFAYAADALIAEMISKGK